MRSTSSHPLALAAAVLALLAVGCTSTTHVNFQAPPGTVMFVDGTPHHLPGGIDFSRPNTAGESKNHPVRLIATVNNQELRAVGDMVVYGFTESDMDKTAINTCILDEQNLSRLFDPSQKVVFRGESASRQPLYDLSLKKQ